MRQARRILVVVAHPDDAEFGCGGSVAQWVADGCEVSYCLFTSGNRGSDDPAMTPERLATIREGEQRAAAAVLGVRQVTFLGYPDGELEDTREARRDIVREVRRVRPDRLVIQNPFPSLNPYSGHRDHRHAGRLALDAVYPYARDRMHFPELLAEGFLPHKVREVYVMGHPEPDVVVDITGTMARKLEALRCHASQLRDFAGAEARVRERAAELGKPRGYTYAEAYRSIDLPR
ncbi:MAG TPA: PIG-L deacetylase family protein [Methylomirabilota bacterium]|jgi:LmbE family N-acetylglucosaminyl deacetylase|nr:PIG-L deacetylase family protein [Methylomirabilota bacterium]